jgi:hypothetical protein
MASDLVCPKAEPMASYLACPKAEPLVLFDLNLACPKAEPMASDLACPKVEQPHNFLPSKVDKCHSIQHLNCMFSGSYCIVLVL